VCLEILALTIAYPCFLLSYVQRKAKPITEFSQNDIKNVMLIDERTQEECVAGHTVLFLSS